MKNLRFVLTLAAVGLIGQGMAQELGASWMSRLGKAAPQPEVEEETDRFCEVFANYLTVGANYSRINFKPDGDPSFNGNLGGLHGKYEYKAADEIYAGIELDWRQGSMSGSAGKRTLIDLDVAEKIGYTWGRYNEDLFSLYTGFGFRYLDHHLHPSKASSQTFSGSFFPPVISSQTSLKFQYCEFYIPVGFLSKYTFTSWFALGVDFEWMPQVFSTVQIDPIGGSHWNLSRTVGNFQVEMPFIFNLTECDSWMLTVNPFYQRWQDGHSTAKTSFGTSLGLPKNTYNFYGVDVNVTYSF